MTQLLKTARLNNLSFKKLIRRYSKNIIQLRDTVFHKAKLNINDWVNEIYTEEQYNSVIQEIGGML